MPRQKLELHVLGVGRGASHVYDGQCSTSMVLAVDDKPTVLIDTGFGATRACLAKFGELPARVVITHNHSDHAAELPVILRVEQARGRTLTVFAETEVARRLQMHRLAEHAEILSSNDIADWRVADTARRVPLYDGADIEFIAGQHSEHSCGFLIHSGGRAVLGYTGDSTVNEPLYARIAEAQTRLYDARPAPSRWHATFEQLAGRLQKGAWIVGHGIEAGDAPEELPLLFAGDRVLLGEAQNMQGEPREDC